jgi:hypothetical protein
MSPTDLLHKMVTKRLKSLKRGPGWLASQIGAKRITIHHFLRRRDKSGGIRKIHYDLGMKLRAWEENNRNNIPPLRHQKTCFETGLYTPYRGFKAWF